LAQSLADGTLSQEQYNEALEASKKKLKDIINLTEQLDGGIENLGDTTQDTAAKIQSTGTGLAGFYNNITSELYGLSAQAEDTFLAMQGATDIDTTDTLGEIGQLETKLAEAAVEADHLSAAVHFDPTGLSDWMSETAANAAHVKEAFYEQKIALERLMQGYEDGSISASQLAEEGRAAADTLNLLDQQDLDRLNQAIEQAEAGMEQLGDSTRSTLDSLQDELDRLQGRQEDIEQRRFEARKRELEDQLVTARQSGDNEAISHLQKALSLNQKILTEKQRQHQQKQQEDARREREKSSRQEHSGRHARRSASESKSPEKIIRLEYPGGQLDVGVKPGDERKLLEALKNAGMRSA
jgi:hypothetical protein